MIYKNKIMYVRYAKYTLMCIIYLAIKLVWHSILAFGLKKYTLQKTPQNDQIYNLITISKNVQNNSSATL